MEPMDLRERSLAEHRAWRQAAEALRAWVADCDCTELPPSTSQAIGALLEQLRRHLDAEEAELRPILQHVDAWGAVRAARLTEARQSERARLAGLMAQLAHPLDEGPLRVHVLNFVDWVGRQLEAEEQEELSERLLDEDPIRDDTCGG